MQSQFAAKRSLAAKKTLRRSFSVSDVQGMKLHPGLPKPGTARYEPGKENKGRSTIGVKRAAALGPILAATAVKRPTPAPPTVTANPPAKKIAPYDYKARFNDLLEKHKPLKAELPELRRQRDELAEENADLLKQKQDLSTETEELRVKDKEREFREAQLLTRIEKAERERDDLEKRNAEVCNELTETSFALSVANRQLNSTTERLAAAERINQQQERLISSQQEDLEELKESTQKLHWERRSLHNKLQDLKGNIRVVCRVRPALSVGRPVATLSFPDMCTLEMERVEPGATRRLSKHDFKFDRVYGPASGQEDVWEEVSCLVQSALDGYNVCIFAYGQTGSGKTYTMEGTRDAPGVVPRTCSMIFDSVKQMIRTGWEYTVHASFLEIYNEQIFDLLDPTKDPKELDIRMVDAKGSDIYVTNLSEKDVDNDMALLKLAAIAQANRQTAATSSNERSSRSHSVARIRLSGVHSGRSLTLTSRICLVDLAGSESAKTTQRLTETKNINKSLSGLTQVILALQQKQDHIPFRNSKLTRLLEPQLGGAAKALLVAAAAPYEDCGHESLSTFRFATQVGHCSTASARRNLAMAQPMAAAHSKEAA